MGKIDTSAWSEFRISDVFETNQKGKSLQVPTGANVQKKDLEEGPIPRITVTGINNGIYGYYEDRPNEDNYRVYENFISVSFLGTVFYQKGKASLDMKVHCLRPLNHTLNEYTGEFLVTAILASLRESSYSDQISSTVLSTLAIKLPADVNGDPDWAYMEEYMRNIEVRVSDSLSKLESAKDVSSDKIDISSWNEFCLSDLFTKKTMKGYQSARTDCIPDENGHYVYGQNIKRQIDYPVILDSQYLHKVDPNHPILAYTSSVCEIGMIDEDFYRSGNNGAFQGLFSINKTLNRYHLQFVLAVLQPVFARFRYDTSMSDTMSLKFKLPVDARGEPDWLYMENYMKSLEIKVKGFLDNTI